MASGMKRAVKFISKRLSSHSIPRASSSGETHTITTEFSSLVYKLGGWNHASWQVRKLCFSNNAYFWFKDGKEKVPNNVIGMTDIVEAKVYLNLFHDKFFCFSFSTTEKSYTFAAPNHLLFEKWINFLPNFTIADSEQISFDLLTSSALFNYFNSISSGIFGKDPETPDVFSYLLTNFSNYPQQLRQILGALFNFHRILIETYYLLLNWNKTERLAYLKVFDFKLPDFSANNLSCVNCRPVFETEPKIESKNSILPYFNDVSKLILTKFLPTDPEDFIGLFFQPFTIPGSEFSRLFDLIDPLFSVLEDLSMANDFDFECFDTSIIIIYHQNLVSKLCELWYNVVCQFLPWHCLQGFERHLKIPSSNLNLGKIIQSSVNSMLQLKSKIPSEILNLVKICEKHSVLRRNHLLISFLYPSNPCFTFSLPGGSWVSNLIFPPKPKTPFRYEQPFLSFICDSGIDKGVEGRGFVDTSDRNDLAIIAAFKEIDDSDYGKVRLTPTLITWTLPFGFELTAKRDGDVWRFCTRLSPYLIPINRYISDSNLPLPAPHFSIVLAMRECVREEYYTIRQIYLNQKKKEGKKRQS
ncbi:hypothetical protein RCL1_005423 [Eukaryota sp. TZLM3-RCL]